MPALTLKTAMSLGYQPNTFQAEMAWILYNNYYPYNKVVGLQPTRTVKKIQAVT
jgi:hypothetical protein